MYENNIAIISNRYIQDDLRGSEEFQKQLFSLLSDTYKISLLTSDIVDLQPLTSPLSKRIRPNEFAVKSQMKVRRFKSHPILSSSAFALSTTLSHFARRNNGVLKDITDFLHVIGWGPLIPGIYNYLLSEDFDLIHGSAFPSTPSFIGLKAAIKKKIPYVYAPYLHYRLPWIFNSSTLRFMIKNSSALIALTESEKYKLVELGADSSNIYVIPLYLETRQLEKVPIPNKAEAKDKLGIKDYFVILTAPHSLKGGIQTLEAASKLSDKYSKIIVLSIGFPKKDFIRKSEILTKIHKNLRVINLGWANTETKFLAHKAADVFSMPSVTDSFGLAYLESWYCETPVIGALNSAADDLIDNDKNGFLVRYGSTNELYGAFEKLLLDEKLSIFLGVNGFGKVMKEYNEKLVKNSYREVFESVIK